MRSIPFVQPSVICPTTFGRQPQVAYLSQLVDQLGEGRGGTVLVTGEAGIGKSRLVGEARSLAAHRGVRVLQGSAFELDQALPYGPIVDLLRASIGGKTPDAVVEELGPALVPLSRLLPALAAWLPSDRDPVAPSVLDQNHQLLQGLLLGFDRLMARGPTMVVIEDIHWADEASLDLLLHLARSTATRPFLLVLTLRPDDAGPSVVAWRNTVERQRLSIELPLLPLDRADVDAMVHSIVPDTLSLSLLHTIAELVEGNPFFIEEVVRTTVFADETRARPDAMQVPRSVHDAVQRRVNGLGEAARRAIQVAAVAGRRFDFSLLQLVLGAEERDLLPVLKELISAQLVVEDADERFAFRHALTRQAVYAGLLGRERRAVHAEVLAALEQLTDSQNGVPSGELSYHAHAACDWAKAARYGNVAGDRALSMHAPRAAVEHFTNAIDSAEKLGEMPAAELLRGGVGRCRNRHRGFAP